MTSSNNQQPQQPPSSSSSSSSSSSPTSWASILRTRNNAKTASSSASLLLSPAAGNNSKHRRATSRHEASEADVLRIFRRSFHDAQRERQSHPSFASVPRFYFKRHVVSDLKQRVRREARTRFLEKKADNLLDEEDLETMWDLLQKSQSPPVVSVNGARLHYESFRRVGKAMSSKAAYFFRPCIFNKFPRDEHGRIAARTFFHYVVRKVSLVQLRISLTCYDDVGAGYLREQDLENYIFELIEGLPRLDSLEIDFYPYYVFTAVRKFIFFLDPLRKGKIPIKDIVASPILAEFNQLRQQPTEDTGDMPVDQEWFSAGATLRIYAAYLHLDADHNGMLSREEFSHFNGRSLTSVFVDRLFQECRMYESETGRMEMDYKTFLDFVLAIQHADTPQGLRYFFKILDINNQGYLTLFDLNFFFKAVVAKMIELGHEPVHVEDVTNEIFDMVRPVQPDRITLDDLINSEVGHTVVGILTDVHGFWQYDNREMLIAHDEQDG